MLNQRIVLASRPTAWVEEANFRFEEVLLAEPGPGQVLVKNHWLSLDPYMRGRMSDAKSYAEPVALGAVMIGGTAGEVIASNNPRFAVGDRVVGRLGWQLYGVAEAGELQKVDATRIPLAAYLGPVGMPGVTAWVGVNDICAPRAGETLLVTAAAGAVGGVVGQLAQARGARAVGIAGGEQKCRYVIDELGFAACVDYKAADWRQQLKAATPEGIDCLFENVGGEIFDTLLTRLNPFARVALCGLVSQYNSAPYPMQNLAALLIKRVTLRGFIVSDDMSRWPPALAELGAQVATGQLHYRESIAEGLQSAPAALIGLLKGANLGKQLVRL